MCRVLAARGPADAITLLDRLVEHPDAAVSVAALETMQALATRGGTIAFERIQPYIRHSEDLVRAAALRLSAAVAPDWKLGEIARTGLSDPIANVRHVAAQAIGGRGEPAIPVLGAMLTTGGPEQRDAAIEGLGFIGGRAADNALFAFIEPTALNEVARNVTLLRQLPAGRPGWGALAAAISDANNQAVHLVLHCLAALGYRRTLKVVRTMLARGDARKRSHAVETLAALAHRRYVLPLMPLLEDVVPQKTATYDPPAQRALLRSALDSTDPFICAAAAIAWYVDYGDVPPQIAHDRRPVVARTREELTAAAANRTSAREDILMNRLVFLKSIPMFSEMTLENLIAVDAAMKRETYLPDEDVVSEGDVGDKLFIVYRGAVGVRKAGNGADLARLGSGQVFGEMSLFDDEPRSATVVAREETEVLSLERDHFHSLAQQRPQIVMEICKVLVGRLRTAIS